MTRGRGLGAAWMLVASLSFAVMGAFVKLASAEFSATELVFYRSLFGLIPLLLWAGLRRKTIGSDHNRAHFGRAMAGMISLWLYFYALTRLPLATAVTLNYTSPLFLALLLGLTGRERLSPALLGLLGVGFVGIVLLLRPHLGADQWGAGALGLLSGFGAGIAYLCVRQLGMMGEPAWRIVIHFTGWSTLLVGLLLLFVPHHPMSPTGLMHLVILGLSATSGQLAMTRAYRVGAPLLVANLAYTTIVFAALLGLIFFREWLPVTAWFGMAVVILAGMGAGMVARRR